MLVNIQFTLRPDFPPMHFYQLFRYCQAQPCAAKPPAGGAIHLRELPEYLGEFILGNANSRIAHADK